MKKFLKVIITIAIIVIIGWVAFKLGVIISNKLFYM